VHHRARRSEQILGWDKITPLLTPRERSFVEEMAAGRYLSPGRVEWLERIYARIFEGGDDEEGRDV
jgi:hypothetical protein